MNKEKNQEIKYPRGENVCVIYCDCRGKPFFLITTKPITGCFFIYEFKEDGLTRLGKGLSPIELEERFDVRKRMGVD